MSTENFVSNANATQLFTKVGEELDKKSPKFTTDLAPKEFSPNPVASGGVYTQIKYLDDYKLDRAPIMPAASEDYEGITVLYIGDTDANYTKSHIYECQEITPSTTPKTYQWVDIGISDGDAIADIVNVYGAKNLLPNNVISQTLNGVTFTVNSDGSVTVNGTATANTGLIVGRYEFKANQNVILSGCPSTGSSNTYKLLSWPTTAPSSGQRQKEDVGQGVLLHYPDNLTCQIQIYIANGQVLNNITFYPMIRLTSIEDDTYVPYAKSNKELTHDIIPLNNSVAGSSDAYDSTKAYAVGDLVIYNNKLYRCKTACSAASWNVNSTNFEETTLTKVATQLNSDLNKHHSKIVTFTNKAANILWSGTGLYHTLTLSLDFSELGLTNVPHVQVTCFGQYLIMVNNVTNTEVGVLAFTNSNTTISSISFYLDIWEQ